MSLAEYIAQLKSRRASLESNFESIVIGAGNNMLQMIQDRIQTKGTGADGIAFKDYTEEYKKRKSKEGKFKGIVDYTLTTRMWSDIQQRIGTVKRSGRIYTFVMGPSTDANEKKFAAMTKRDGQKPTLPSASEIETTKNNLIEDVRLFMFG